MYKTNETMEIRASSLEIAYCKVYDKLGTANTNSEIYKVILNSVEMQTHKDTLTFLYIFDITRLPPSNV